MTIFSDSLTALNAGKTDVRSCRIAVFTDAHNVTHQPAQKAERGTSGAFCGRLNALVRLSCI